MKFDRVKFDRILPPPFVNWFLLPLAVGVMLFTIEELGPWFAWVLTHPGSLPR